jgi:hypothetical protein
LDKETAAIKAVITEMYAMISGPAGPRDWSRQKHVFHPSAKMMRTGVDHALAAWIKIMSLEEYRQNTTPIFATQGFYEHEIGSRIEIFGNMAHAWSAYEARIGADDDKPERRGVNSIQLYRDETGAWRIISMIWDNEREGLALPTI